MNHVMIDLETLGTKPNSVFIALGACQFEPSTGELGHSIYQRIDWNSAMQSELVVDADTIKWWMRQSDAARLELIEEGDQLNCALDVFKDWLTNNCKVWGNGATFDISILEHAYKHNAPWKYWNVRDVRTVVDLAHGIVEKDDINFDGTAHNALDDATHQAKYVSAMWQALKGIDQ